jgi:histidinol-phosphatase (PHP family)
MDLNPPIIGHIDKLKMQYRPDSFIPEEHPLFRDELLKTMLVARDAGSIVEINTRAIYKKRGDTFYPGQSVFNEMNRMGVKVMVNSDAHLPGEITNEFRNAFTALKMAGYNEHYILSEGKYKSVAIS